MVFSVRLYLIEILHQTTTQECVAKPGFCCILSKFYIKPQLIRHVTEQRWVVSYRNSTSNHNGKTTLVNAYYVVSYRNSTSNHNPDLFTIGTTPVVSYRNSTSNHNCTYLCTFPYVVVSYRNSTSNHNNASATSCA